MNDLEILTPRGLFSQDPANIWHYHTRQLGHVSEACRDALTLDRSRAALFWFNDTPAPIFRNDTPETLEARWREWRTTYQDGPHDGLLVLLLKLGGLR